MGTNSGKHFWSALNYIIESFREYGNSYHRLLYGIDRKSITLPMEEWTVLDKQFDDLEKVISDTMQDASQLVDDLEEMKWLSKEDNEVYRKATQKMAEGMIARLENYVNDENDDERVCQMCGKSIQLCKCTCSRCGEQAFDDVTLADHGMCYDCLQKWKFGKLEI